jgi:hypothetical protein
MSYLPSHRWRVRLLAGGGLVALCFAVLVTVVPVDPLRGVLVGFVTGVGSETLAWLLAFLAVGFAIVRLVRGRARPAVAPAFLDAPPEEARSRPRTTDEAFRRRLRRATRQAEDPQVGDSELRERLRETAVDVVARTETGDRAAPERAVDRGAWTDDRVAAAFLGGERAPGFGVGHRLRRWLRPDLAFERRVERTVDAIHDRIRGDR